MPFETSAGQEDGYYGVYKYDFQSGEDDFHPCGREIILDGMTENIEDELQSTTWRLAFEFNGSTKIIEVPCENNADRKMFLYYLSKAGADVSPKNFTMILDTIRLQQEQLELKHGVKRIYEHLGWIELPKVISSSQPDQKYYYRGKTLLGDGTIRAKYTGPYMVNAAGSFGTWKQGVINDVVGHEPLEIVLLAGLAAPVNGLIAPMTTGENPIFHIYGISGSGKTTGCELAVSTSGAPFQGASNERKSLLSTWGATEKALIRRCEGNRGAVIALNEIAKCTVPDMSSLVYNLSEGTDLERLTADLKAKCSEVYYTTFISTGEISMLERCKSKAEGLSIRVMEITEPLTDNAAQADRIKKFCHSNYGHAVPKLVRYIIKSGGLDYVLPIYKGYCQNLISKFPESRFRERFIEKFPALILTTAKIATAALGIPFDMGGILDYFIKYASEHNIKDAKLDSYEVIIEECRKNINCFYQPQSEPPRGKIYGKVTYPKRVAENGRFIAEEYAVRKSYVDSILADNNFQNKRTCIQAWKREGVLDCDADRPTRSRKLVSQGKSEDVYVFRVYADPGEADDNDYDSGSPKLRLSKKKSETLKHLLDNEGGEDTGNGSIA